MKEFLSVNPGAPRRPSIENQAKVDGWDFAGSQGI